MLEKRGSGHRRHCYAMMDGKLPRHGSIWFLSVELFLYTYSIVGVWSRL